MPTCYVTTKFTLAGKVGGWDRQSDEEREDMVADMIYIPCHELSVKLINSDNDSSHMSLGVDESFHPKDSLKLELNEETGEYKLEFDGVIKLPITSNTEAALAALPKQAPTILLIDRHVVGDRNMVLATNPFTAPCMVTKSKPKEASF
jgi:hypothetical protein